jgi:hypothetical protein
MIYPPFHTRKQNDGSDNEVPYFQENFQNQIHIDIFIWPKCFSGYLTYLDQVKEPPIYVTSFYLNVSPLRKPIQGV